jgi:ABC transport system ATP-binding/permease protein
MSILSFNNIDLNLAGNQILDKAALQIHENDKIALVGRNGAGKSTLIKLLLGEMTPDKGEIKSISNLKVAGLTQHVPISHDEKVYQFLVKDLGEVGQALATFIEWSSRGESKALSDAQDVIDRANAWDYLSKIDAMASRLGLNKEAEMRTLSGGMKRRALLASALIAEPDLLILDEPTNHLDVQSIEWLESYLKTYTGSFLLVTHDRAFLSQVASRIIEIDRGQLNPFDCSYETYLDRREAMRLSEDKQSALFDKRLSQEESWLRQGVKARRTRNEGRVRALKKMREAYQNRRAEQGRVDSIKLDVSRSGKLVLEAEHVCYHIEEKPLIEDFSIRLMRGDRVGIIGPNGSGKTTLVRLLLGELTPLSGTIKLGTSLNVAYFDQLRRVLDEDSTVMKNVADGSDFVTINGKQKHVASYLKEFLFPPDRFNVPVSTLSGGEKNRLMLAKLLAKPVNLLVMDEPTNDLDIETLELLETLLVDFPGTLILISHDRAFIDNVVTSVLVYEGDAQFNEYVGGYSDYQTRISNKKKNKAQPEKPKEKNNKKLSFNEQRELSKLPKEIERLEDTISALQHKMASPDFYQQAQEAITEVSAELSQQEQKLATLYSRWEALEEKQSK